LGRKIAVWVGTWVGIKSSCYRESNADRKWRICFEWPDRSPGPVKVEIVTITKGKNMPRTAIHPGEHLAEQFKELGLSVI